MAFGSVSHQLHSSSFISTLHPSGSVRLCLCAPLLQLHHDPSGSPSLPQSREPSTQPQPSGITLDFCLLASTWVSTSSSSISIVRPHGVVKAFPPWFFSVFCLPLVHLQSPLPPQMCFYGMRSCFPGRGADVRVIFCFDLVFTVFLLAYVATVPCDLLCHFKAILVQIFYLNTKTKY